MTTRRGFLRGLVAAAVAAPAVVAATNDTSGGREERNADEYINVYIMRNVSREVWRCSRRALDNHAKACNKRSVLSSKMMFPDHTIVRVLWEYNGRPHGLEFAVAWGDSEWQKEKQIESAIELLNEKWRQWAAPMVGRRIR